MTHPPSTVPEPPVPWASERGARRCGEPARALLEAIALALLIGAPLLAGSEAGSGIATETKLSAGDGEPDDYFGAHVSLFGATALVGSPRDDDSGVDAGSAYVFVKDGTSWSQEAKLLASDGAADDRFGDDVAVWGDTALVGASQADAKGTESGAVYVFVRSGGLWIEQAKLTPGDGHAGDRFGEAVSLSGNTALIGAYTDDPLGEQSGSAYVFVRTADRWEEQAKLVPGDGQLLSWFGSDVSISGDTALIGANGEGLFEGSAYIFTRSAGVWSEQAKLLPATPEDFDYFGTSVSLSADTALVGALGNDAFGNGTGVGSAYVFVRTAGAWTQQARLLPGSSESYQLFGASVSLFGDRALVGVPRDNDNGLHSGSAYLFERQAHVWTQQEEILAADGVAGDELGLDVSLWGDTRLVGAPFDDDNGSNSGSVWIFETGALGLSLTGACPGPVTLIVWNAPPSSEVGVVAAADNGGFTKGGVLCAGTRLEIGEPFQLPPTWLVVDDAGIGSAQMTLEPDRCWVEALALASCEPSGAVLVP